MGLTLEELKLILESIPDNACSFKKCAICNIRDEAFRLIKREIKLKEINPVTGRKYADEKKGN